MTNRAVSQPIEAVSSPTDRLSDASERLRTDFERQSVDERDAERTSLKAIINQVPDYLFVKDIESRFTIANNAVTIDNGFTSLVGKTDFDLHPPEKAAAFLAIEQEIMRSGTPRIDMEECVPGVSGTTKWVLTSKLPLRNEHGDIVGLVGIARDITERKHSDSARRGHARLLEMIATGAPLEDILDNLMREVEGHVNGVQASVLLVDGTGKQLTLGAAPSLPQAYSKAIDGIAIGPSAGSCGTAAYRRQSVIVDDILTDPLWDGCYQIAAAYELRSCWSTPILGQEGTVLGTLAVYSPQVRRPTAPEMQLIDMATHIAGIAIERRRDEKRIQFMAHHDALTGLPNRVLLKDRLSQAILHAQRDDRWVTVAFLDLDDFKRVNDNLGHSTGDEFLQIVAQRLVACLRSTDTAVRLGGDEFVILLVDQPSGVEVSTATIQRIQTALTAPVEIAGRSLQVTCCVGVASYPKDGCDAESLLANADVAMYRAKAIGRNNFQLFEPEMSANEQRRFSDQEKLRQAVARSEFVLQFQPQVDLKTGRIFGVEALVRWQHPTLGLLPPAEFIPLAEETGLIVPIGDWVLHTACSQNRAWQVAGAPKITMSVNVSARQFQEKSWINRVKHALEESELEPQYLELELTESVLMHDVEQAAATMRALEELGVQLAIDDFGTGYSSLSTLKSFPVSRLKIDKSFVDALLTNENASAITSAVIALGKKLHLRVIAEGVETDRQLAFLREKGCEEIQGFHFSRPVAAREIEALLRG